MKTASDVNQKSKVEPLFGAIEPEWIELEDVEGKAQKLLEPTARDVILLLVVFLFVFIDNGDIALPLFLVIPEILIHAFSAPFFVTLPCFIAVIGIGMTCYHFRKEPKDRSDYRVINFGLSMLGIALYLFFQVSESPLITLFGGLCFIAAYFYIGRKRTYLKYSA